MVNVLMCCNNTETVLVLVLLSRDRSYGNIFACHSLAGLICLQFVGCRTLSIYRTHSISCSEKQAVEQFDIKYVEANKLRDGNDFMLLCNVIIKKTPNNQQINVSYSTWTRIKQQYNMSAKRTIKCNSTTMNVDDSVLIVYWMY